MKYCPRCDSTFADTDQFCELDGTPLIYEPDEFDVVEFQESADAPVKQDWALLIVMAVVGVAIGIVLMVGYQLINGDPPERTPNRSSSNNTVPERRTSYSREPSSIEEDASPSPEPSPSPTENPSPTVQPGPARVVVSSNPVSTARDQKAGSRKLVIQLTNGTTIEADDVWETAEGIWYRRNGMVSLLPRDRVKGVETEGASSPTSTPATASSSSPSSP